MSDEPIKVLVVEDSPVVQQLLTHVIDGDRRLRVVGVAADAVEAVRKIHALHPDVVTMDIRLPHMNGFEATRWIMREHPLPIVVVASNVDDKSLNISMNALRAGALSVVAKPAGTGRADYDAVAEHLCTQLVIMSEIKVVRQIARGVGAKPLKALASPRPVDMVALVASTGGPGAISRILGDLPAGFAAPVVVVQHMGAPFMGGFTNWLGTLSALPVALAADRQPALPGHVYVAPGNLHLTVVDGLLRLSDAPLVQGQRPSGDVLFTSLADAKGGRAVGVLLTGMGRDGAQGLKAMRDRGFLTIAQDQATSAVYGMPKAAATLGAAQEILPLPRIAPRLVRACGGETTRQKG